MANWNEAAQIRGALRQIYRRSPERKAVVDSAKVKLPRYKKDGSRAKRDSVFIKCALCAELFKESEIEVDHLNGVPPSPGTRNAPPDATWDQVIDELFYGEQRVLCKPCHKKRTKEQRKK